MEMDLAPAFAALGDPIRFAVIAQLAEGEADVGTLAETHGTSQPAMSHHLKVLEGAGLIERTRIGTRRPCHIAPGKVAEIERWVANFRDTLESNYARLDALLEEKPQ